MKFTILFAVATLLFAVHPPAQAEPVTYEIDATHSSVSFQIRHFFNKVSGRFNDFEGQIVLDKENPENSSVEVTIHAKSIDTANENRDEHLRSDDFFHVDEHPAITFKSTSVKVIDDQTAEVTGDFTMNGVTREKVLLVNYLGEMPDGRGNMKVGFESQLKLMRPDYDLTWNQIVEGSRVLGEEVEIDLQIQAQAEIGE